MATTDVITKIEVEGLTIFGIATKELRQSRASESPVGCQSNTTEVCVEKFLKKAAGRTDLEDALQKLSRLTQEARMVLAELLRVTHSVDSKVESVRDIVEDMGEDIGDEAQCVDEKVQVIIDGTWGVFSQSQIPSNSYFHWQTTRRKEWRLKRES